MASAQQWSSEDDDQNPPKRYKRSPFELSNLPLEVLQNIFQYLSFENISNIRLVSKDFNKAGIYALNSEFIRVKKEALKRHQYLQSRIPVYKDKNELLKHPLYKESKIIETVYKNLKVLNVRMGKFLERKEVCFYGGMVLDEANLVLSGKKRDLPNPTADLEGICNMLGKHFTYQIKPSLPKPHVLENFDTYLCVILTGGESLEPCDLGNEEDDELLFIIRYDFKNPDDVFSHMA